MKGRADRGSINWVRRPVALMLSALTCLAAFIDNGQAQNQTRQYSITDLGALASEGSSAFAININGDVAGYSSYGVSRRHTRPQDHHYILYPDNPREHGLSSGSAIIATEDSIADLRPFIPPAWSAATGINDIGHVVGLYRPHALLPDNWARPFLLQNGQFIDLGCFPTTDPSNDHGLWTCHGYASGINNRGQVIGATRVRLDGQFITFLQAFLYTPGASGLINLGALGGLPTSTALAINDHGDVIGYYGRIGIQAIIAPFRGFLYYNGQMVTNLGDFLPHALNNVGQIVGSSSSGPSLFNISDGTIAQLDFSRFPNGTVLLDAYAAAINDAGEIVGNAQAVDFINGGKTLEVFHYYDGKLNHLNSLLRPGSGCRIQYVAAINTQGQIAGSGRCPSSIYPHAVLLTPESPCVPPTSLARVANIAAQNVCPVPDIEVTFEGVGQTDALVGQVVTFTPKLNSLTGVTRWEWDFGDGITQRETSNKSVEHVYTEAGPFRVSLKLFSAAGVLLGEPPKDITVRCDLDPDRDAKLDKKDCDGDALPNDWEIEGIKDGDGNVILDLPAMGADPLHKDIFVQVDYMRGKPDHALSHQLSIDAIALVIEAFENASDVENPDGTTGIRLHVDAGAEHIMNPVLGTKWGECSTADPAEVCSRAKGLQEKRAFADTAETDVVKIAFDKAGQLSKERLGVFHYVISAHFLAEGCQIDNSGVGVVQGEKIRGISLGIPSSEFVMTLGNYENHVGSVQEQALAFMHELGHNLGLMHGGNDSINNKPNYLSVMNYSYGHRGGLSFGGSYENLDYSRFEASVLVETNLDESLGVTGTDVPRNYGILYYCLIAEKNSCTITNNATSATASGPIDWNCNNRPESGVPSDINGDGEIFTTAKSFRTQNDWKAIKLDGGGIIGNLSGGNGNAVLVAEGEGEFPMPSNYYDPVVVSLPQPSWQNFLFPGQQVTLAFLVKNSTPKQRIYTFKVISPKGWALINALPQSIFLQPDEQTTVGLTVRVPVTARAGEKEQGEFTVMTESSTKPGVFVIGEGQRYEVYVVSSDDKDGDGVKDAVDNCPFDPNSDQDDSDDNGVGDPCEGIPASDTMPPILTLRGKAATEATGTAGAVVAYTTSAMDAVDGAVTPICTPASGSTFALGTTNVGCLATDKAGNTASGSFSITVRDTTLPTIIGNVSPAANANGWHNSTVTVNFTCADTASGIAACTTPQTLGEGPNQSVNGTASDKAGNIAKTTVVGINVDLTPPVVNVTGVTDGATYALGAVPPAGCSTTDALSSVQTAATLSLTGGNSDGVGTFTATCARAMDKAGNSSAMSAIYRVKGGVMPSDFDGDGVPNDQDACPHSNLSRTVIVDTCNSGVANKLLANGCTITDKIAICAKNALNHGQFVECVAQLINRLKKNGTISNSAKGKIQACAAQADIP